MCLADAQPEKYAKLSRNVTSCVFFGTPFRGAEPALLAVKFCELKRLWRDNAKDCPEYNTKLLEFMSPDSKDLHSLTADFKRVARSMQPEMTLFCFNETRPLNWLAKVKSIKKSRDVVSQWAIKFVDDYQRKVRTDLRHYTAF